MNENIKVSIILPVYNVEKYLRQCINSIIEQTLREIEVICINDGSIDRSLKIIQEYATNDPRIKVISKDNEGLSAARNDGMLVAKGEYLLFLDSDDYIDITYCEVLYKAAKKYNADLAFGGIVAFYSISNFCNGVFFSEFTAEEKQYFEINQSNRIYFFEKSYTGIATAWGRIIRREMLEEHSIKFYKERTSEDIPFTFLNLLYANAITVDDSVRYYYRKGIASSLSKKVDNMTKALLKNLNTLKGDLIERGYKNSEFTKIINLTACDVLFGYYDDWNVGNFSRCSLKTVKELYLVIKNTYMDFFEINTTVYSESNKKFKLKYKFFAFGIKYNIYLMPKLMRTVRNIIRILTFK